MWKKAHITYSSAVSWAFAFWDPKTRQGSWKIAHHQVSWLLMQLIYDGTDSEYCFKQLNQLSEIKKLKMNAIYREEKKFCFLKLQVAIKTSKKQLFWQNRIVFKFCRGLRTQRRLHGDLGIQSCEQFLLNLGWMQDLAFAYCSKEEVKILSVKIYLGTYLLRRKQFT